MTMRPHTTLLLVLSVLSANAARAQAPDGGAPAELAAEPPDDTTTRESEPSESAPSESAASESAASDGAASDSAASDSAASDSAASDSAAIDSAAIDSAASEREVPPPPIAEPQDAAAAAGPQLRPLASLFTRFEHREGYTRLGVSPPGCSAGDGDCLRFRARVGLLVTPLRITDEVTASIRFLPQVAGYWAMPSSAGGPATSGGAFDPTLGVHEASLILTIGPPLRLEIGRFEMVYGEHLTIGNLDWHPNGRAFDGARVRIQPEADGAWVDAFWTLLSEGNLPTFGQNDRYFYGVYAGLGPAIAQGLALDAYALFLQSNDSADAATGEERDLVLRATLGGRVRHRVELVDFRVETALQVGHQGAVTTAGVMTQAPRTILAGHIDGEVGLNFADDRMRVALEGAFASGDDPSTADVNEAYDQLFPTGHAWLGLSDVMGGRSNVATGVVHLTGKPLPELQINLDVHVFARPERGAAPDEYAGTEGDLHVVWRPGAGLRGRAMYALFVPNAGSFPMGTDPVHYLEIEVGYVLE